MIAGMYDQSIMNMIQKLKDEDEDSAVIADELYRIGRSMQDDYLMGIAVYGRARARLFDSLHLNAVMTDALEAVEHSKLAKNYDTLCRAYILLGIVSDIHINYPLAVAYYIDAAGIVPKTENPKLNGAIVNTNIAQIFAAVHEYEKAEYYNNMAIELMIGAEKTPAYVRDMASMLASSASYALEAENDIAEAEKKYSEAEKLRGREGWDEFSDMDQLLTRIRISAARHDDAEVMKYYHDFMAIQTSLPYTADCIEGVNYLLSYMIEHRQFEACKEIVAYVESRLDTEVPGVLMQVYDEEIRYYKAIGNTEKEHAMALKYYEASMKKANEDDRAAVIAVEGSLSGARLSEENTRLLKEAETDQLTGLPNRYALHTHSEELFDACYREQRNLGVEIMDVDFFKEYNDTYGHVKGDECLKAVADVIKKEIRKEPGMFAARYGGDEIILMYDSLSEERMEEIMQEIEDGVRDLHMEHRNSKVSDSVSISQGLYSAVPKFKNRIWDYTAGADNVLYYVKNHHKGSWCHTNRHNYRSPENGTKGWEKEKK